MLAKSEREEAVLPALAAAAGVEGEPLATAQAAVPMAKADLATAVVTEFTSLAGVIGRHYAEMEGHPQPVRHASAAKDRNSMKVRQRRSGMDLYWDSGLDDQGRAEEGDRDAVK